MHNIAFDDNEIVSLESFGFQLDSELSDLKLIKQLKNIKEELTKISTAQSKTIRYCWSNFDEEKDNDNSQNFDSFDDLLFFLKNPESCKC